MLFTLTVPLKPRGKKNSDEYDSEKIISTREKKGDMNWNAGANKQGGQCKQMLM